MRGKGEESVAWRRRCEILRSSRHVRMQVDHGILPLTFFSAANMKVVELHHVVQGEEHELDAKRMVVLRSVHMARHP